MEDLPSGIGIPQRGRHKHGVHHILGALELRGKAAVIAQAGRHTTPCAGHCAPAARRFIARVFQHGSNGAATTKRRGDVTSGAKGRPHRGPVAVRPDAGALPKVLEGVRALQQVRAAAARIPERHRGSPAGRGAGRGGLSLWHPACLRQLHGQHRPIGKGTLHEHVRQQLLQLAVWHRGANSQVQCRRQHRMLGEAGGTRTPELGGDSQPCSHHPLILDAVVSLRLGGIRGGRRQGRLHYLQERIRRQVGVWTTPAQLVATVRQRSQAYNQWIVQVACLQQACLRVSALGQFLLDL
mmetsp:Transcript_176708/g.566665  ORF Transcript_176708/g.566665 Transcript_176708/m.566665 type:complete len:296 (-) Transcript_176708:3611-4498(-)